MLDKIKSFIKQNKDDNILKKQNFKPYFIGSGNEVDLSVLDSEINEQKLCEELEAAFQKGEERKLLIQNSDKAFFPSEMYGTAQVFSNYCQQKQTILKNKMKELCSHEEVLKLMENPTEFFKRGWCYPNPYAHDIIGMEYRDRIISGKGYIWNFCLDKKFFDNPKNFYAFYKCAVQYFGNRTREVLNNLDDNAPYATNDLRKLFQEYLGFKIEFETHANNHQHHVEKLLAKINKRLEIEPTEEDKAKQQILQNVLPEYAKFQKFTFKGEKLLISEYERICPGQYKEQEKTHSCGFEMM